MKKTFRLWKTNGDIMDIKTPSVEVLREKGSLTVTPKGAKPIKGVVALTEGQPPTIIVSHLRDLDEDWKES